MNKTYIFGTLFLAHLSISWISMTKEAVIDQSTVSTTWAYLSAVIKFPVFYLPLSQEIYDYFPMLFISNSFIMSLTLTFVAIYLTRISSSMGHP